MTPELNELLARYLNADDATKLAEQLGAYLKEVALVFKPDIEPWEVLAQLALVLPMHTSRQHISLEEDGNLSAAAGAFAGIKKPHELTELSELILRAVPENARRPLNWALPDPVDVIGYDPRFPDQVGLKTAFETVAAAQQEKLGRFDLRKDYATAKNNIFLDFHDRTTRYDLLVVDFSWLPELAYQGHLLSLETFEPDIVSLIHKQLGRFLQTGKADWWTPVLSYLCRAGNTQHYALPLFVNLQGRLLPAVAPVSDPRRHTMSTNLDYLADSFEGATIQAALSACLSYELYAHFCFYNSRPITVAGGELFTIDRPRFSSDEAKDAVADYAARLFVASRARGKVERGAVVKHDHEDEIKDLQESSPGVGEKWDPVFNTELLSRLAFPGNWDLVQPIKNSETGNYLSCLGGYGLAISRQSVQPANAFRVAKGVFSLLSDTAATPADSPLRPITAKVEAFNLDCEALLFAERHSRPRVPFWSQVEDLLSSAVLEVLFGIDLPAGGYLKVRKEIRKYLSDHTTGGRLMTRLEECVELLFRNNGWQVK